MRGLLLIITIVIVPMTMSFGLMSALDRAAERFGLRDAWLGIMPLFGGAMVGTAMFAAIYMASSHGMDVPAPRDIVTFIRVLVGALCGAGFWTVIAIMSLSAFKLRGAQ